MSNKSKGVLPDGAKIRKLRKQVGKTQKGLINNTVVMLRTLQRAEQGKPILPDMLGAIAASLGVTSDEIRISAGTDDHAPRAIVRLGRLDPPSVSKLVTLIQDGVARLDVEFDLDPDESTAERLAEVAEIFEEFRADQDRDGWFEATSDPYSMQDNKFTPAQEIRKIGRLNTQLQALTEAGIYTFVGAYTEWYRVEKWKQEPGRRTAWYIPKRIKVVTIKFSTERADYLTKNNAEFSRELVEKEITNYNVVFGISPDWVIHALSNPFLDEMGKEFVKNYKRAFDDHHKIGGTKEQYEKASMTTTK